MEKILVIFEMSDMTIEKYDQVMMDLEKAGATFPKGRPHHFSAPAPDGWCVVDVWNSPNELNEFAATLMPILVKNGVQPPQPRIFPIHNELS